MRADLALLLEGRGRLIGPMRYGTRLEVRAEPARRVLVMPGPADDPEVTVPAEDGVTVRVDDLQGEHGGPGACDRAVVGGVQVNRRATRQDGVGADLAQEHERRCIDRD